MQNKITEDQESEYRKKLIKFYNIFQSKDKDSDEFKETINKFCQCADEILGNKELKNNKLLLTLMKEISYISRIFSYLDTLKNLDSSENSDTFEENIFDTYVKDFYTLPNSDKPIHPYLYDLYTFFEKYKRIIVSAPTSFGKTRLLLDILNNFNYSLVLISLPTNALINEFMENLYAEKNLNSFYKVTSIEDYKSINEKTDSKMILVLTPEKVLSLFSYDQKAYFDLGVVDEIHKASQEEEDQRYEIISNTIYKIAANSRDLYCVGPFIENFKNIAKLKAKFIKYDVELVSKKEEEIKLKSNDLKYKKIIEKILESREKKHTTLIYCPTRGKTEEVGKKIINSKKYKEIINSFQNKEINSINNLIEYINKCILVDADKDKWSLVDFLKNRIAFHHASVPIEVQMEIVDLFNKKLIDVIFCTSTLIEGINLSAKNIIFYKLIKDVKSTKMSSLKFKNIVGRAGRLGKHFLGNIYTFDKEIENEREEVSLNIELNEHKSKKTIELMVQMKTEDLNPDEKKEIKDLKEKYEKEGIDIEVLKKNIFVNLENQFKLVKIFKNMDEKEFKNFSKADFSNKEEDEECNLTKVIRLCRYNIFSESDKNKTKNKKFDEGYGYTVSQLSYFYSLYIKSFKNYENPIRALYGSVPAGNNNDINNRINITTRLIAEFCSFSLPKYIDIFYKLYKYVSEERGLNDEENGTNAMKEYINEGTDIIALLTALRVPITIIEKIKPTFAKCKNTIDLRVKYDENKGKLKEKLSEFEFKTLKRFFGDID